MNTLVVNQAIFYLFIAFSILLVLGYSWGKRKNGRIYKQAFEELIKIFRPQEQKFTYIGGLTGYHANFLPKNHKFISRVDATITLLPRQSLLYYPFSRLIRGFDRLFITLHLKAPALKGLQEAHLIEKDYTRFKGPKITNRERLDCQEVDWQGLRFYLYSGSSKDKEELNKLLDKSGLPGQIRHFAFMSQEQRAFVFMIPKLGAITSTLPKLMSWLNNQNKNI